MSTTINRQWRLARRPRGELSTPRNYLELLIARGRMEGFVVLDYIARAHDALPVLQRSLREGKLEDKVDVMHGLENAPASLARLFGGENQGKQLLRIAERSV